MFNEEDSFKKVEDVLSCYPKEYSNNYYANKRNLVITKEEPVFKNVGGFYDEEKNVITIYNDSALVHELFHMSFRNPNKVLKPITTINNIDVLSSNGIATARYINSKKIISGKALTEGFVRYLTKKCTDDFDNSISYFFTNILIQIYGEDILKYPLQNNCVDFLLDDRFSDIAEIQKQLDIYLESEDSIKLISYSKSTLIKILESDNEKLKKQIFNIMKNCRIDYKKSILNLFSLLIKEYMNCDNPHIDMNYILLQYKMFMILDNYRIYYAFDDEKLSVKENTKKLIKKYDK